jgi:hypothetical protein
VVDKGITARWLGYERADTATGTLLFALGGGAVLTACALAFSATSWHGDFVDAGMVAAGLGHRSGWAGALLRAYLLLAAVVVIIKVTQLI